MIWPITLFWQPLDTGESWRQDVFIVTCRCVLHLVTNDLWPIEGNYLSSGKSGAVVHTQKKRWKDKFIYTDCPPDYLVIKGVIYSFLAFFQQQKS